VDDPGFETRKEKEIFYYPKRPDRLWTQPTLLFIGFISEVKEAGA